MSDPISVRTLLRHEDVAFAISNLRTLVACCDDKFRLVVHDDGSLTSEDVTAIVAAIPGARVVSRHEADAIMAERLARHRHAAQFRRESVWGLKLLDIALLDSGDCFYLDSDIRFLRRFRGLFHPEAAHGRAVFLRDINWAAYSIRPWHLLGHRLSVVQPINSGLTLIDEQCYDLDFVDWFLAERAWRVIPAWVEPTCWAALAARTDAFAVDSRQFVNAYPKTRLWTETFAVHLLSSYRGRFKPLVDRAPEVESAVVITRFEPLRHLRPLELGWNQLARKVSNEYEKRRRPGENA